MLAAPGSLPDILLRATHAVRLLRGRIQILKLGGSALEDPNIVRATLESLVALQTLGLQLAVVHGGGKPIDRAMDEAGLKPLKVQGRRYTDDATLQIVVRVLNEINAQLADQLQQLGGRCFSYAKAKQVPLLGDRLMLPGLDLQPVDLGHVGKVTGVIPALKTHFINNEAEIPLVASLALGPDGGCLNINADTAASALAGALKADAVLFLTDTPGVLRDINNPASLYRQLTRPECQQLISDGVINGGMIPKVEACFEAMESGAKRAMILDGRVPYVLLHWILGEPIGTAIVQ
jgi:acetylglutamate kinase